jgi:hypothetical protein
MNVSILPSPVYSQIYQRQLLLIYLEPFIQKLLIREGKLFDVLIK